MTTVSIEAYVTGKKSLNGKRHTVAVTGNLDCTLGPGVDTAPVFDIALQVLNHVRKMTQSIQHPDALTIHIIPIDESNSRVEPAVA